MSTTVRIAVTPEIAKRLMTEAPGRRWVLRDVSIHKQGALPDCAILLEAEPPQRQKP